MMLSDFTNQSSIPILAWVAYLLHYSLMGYLYSLILTFLLIGAVLAAIYHSETIAYRVSEVSLETISLARDMVFAAIMIILTGIIGACNAVGSIRFINNRFYLAGCKYRNDTLL
ncbi:hypothetical protein [Epilithonimonas sp.]|uniref:hypothetical protein n=1 Tax=Epilithonimonas sp. TaxID=2894511 RepID=UPI00289DC2C7|nr:hypothetical protein [Epilithonimonas sp.]